MIQNILYSAPAANQMPPVDGGSSQIKIFIILAIVFLIVAFFCKIYIPFFRRLKLCKMELKRSDGEEYEYWVSELRELYCRYIPFAFLFLRKRK